jgi:hypothetical protein
MQTSIFTRMFLPFESNDAMLFANAADSSNIFTFIAVTAPNHVDKPTFSNHAWVTDQVCLMPIASFMVSKLIQVSVFFNLKWLSHVHVTSKWLLLNVRNSIVRITSRCAADLMFIKTGTSSGLFAPDWASIIHSICHCTCRAQTSNHGSLKLNSLRLISTRHQYSFPWSKVSLFLFPTKNIWIAKDHRLGSILRQDWRLGFATSSLQLFHQICAMSKQMKH